MNQFEKLNCLVGAEIVEFAPMIVPSKFSNAVAAKTLREMELLLHK